MNIFLLKGYGNISLNNSKQGKDFRILRGELINIPEAHDEKVELINTHTYLLAEEEHITSISEVLRKLRKND